MPKLSPSKALHLTPLELHLKTQVTNPDVRSWHCKSTGNSVKPRILAAGRGSVFLSWATLESLGLRVSGLGRF